MITDATTLEAAEAVENIKTSVINRALLLLTDAPKAWDQIAVEPGGFRELFVPYGVTLAAVRALMMVLQLVLLNAITMPALMAVASSFAHIVIAAAISFVSACAMPVLVSRLMVMVAPRFKAKADWLLSCRVLVYASTPFAAASVVGIIPILGHLAILVGFLWSAALLYQGVNRVLGADNDNRLLFVGCIALFYFVGGMLVSAVFFSAYGGMLYGLR